MVATPRKRKRWKLRNAKEKKYTIFLNDQFSISVRYRFRSGEVIEFAAILVRSTDEGNSFDEICRYDTAHDFAHLDILDHQRKVIKKIAIVGLPSYEEAITYAISDLKANCAKYWQNYWTRKSKAQA